MNFRIVLEQKIQLRLFEWLWIMWSFEKGGKPASKRCQLLLNSTVFSSSRMSNRSGANKVEKDRTGPSRAEHVGILGTKLKRINWPKERLKRISHFGRYFLKILLLLGTFLTFWAIRFVSGDNKEYMWDPEIHIIRMQHF